MDGNTAHPKDEISMIDQITVLRSALGAMLTQFGMDEDEWNCHTFNQARAAMHAVDAPVGGEQATEVRKAFTEWFDRREGIRNAWTAWQEAFKRGKLASTSSSAPGMASVDAAAYSLRWANDPRLNLSTVFDTEAEAKDWADRCEGPISIVPLFERPIEPVKEADVSAIRDAALEESAKACEGEQVEGTGHEGDEAYNLAIEHCAAAIRALRGGTP